MEDAQIVSGNGTVDRSTTPGSGYGSGSDDVSPLPGMSISQYAARRRALAPGGELQEAMACMRANQAPLRKHIEDRAKAIASEEARYR